MFKRILLILTVVMGLSTVCSNADAHVFRRRVVVRRPVVVRQSFFAPRRAVIVAPRRAVIVNPYAPQFIFENPHHLRGTQSFFFFRGF
jgi:hypothetical protein